MKPAFILRIATVPPIVAMIMILLLHFTGGYFAGFDWLWAIFFISVVPSIAYPLSSLLPRLKTGGRYLQRILAVSGSILGYMGGLLYCLLGSGGRIELYVYLSYFVSVLLIALFSYVFKIKSSGHACGLAGPVLVLSLVLNKFYALGFLLLIPIFWSSLKLNRHTLSELLWGASFPMIVFALPYFFL